MKNIPLTVEEFIARSVLPEFHETAALIRRYMSELAPEANEEISYGIPAYRVRCIIAVISPTKKDITLSFSRGAMFEDRPGLLRGVGHTSKHLKYKHAQEVDKEVLAYYVNQALAWEQKG